MSNLTKKRVHWYEVNKDNGEVIADEDVDVLTSADSVTFDDGDTLQRKYDDGELAKRSEVGNIKGLSTTNKSSLVDAVNEVVTKTTTNAAAIENVLSTSKSYTDTKVANLVGAAPETLDTLEEVAQAIAENGDVVTALNNAIGTKASDTDLKSHTSNKNNPHDVTKEQLGMSNVDNTSDKNKPVSTAQQEAINNALNQAKGYTDNSKMTVITTSGTYLRDYKNPGVYYFGSNYRPVDFEYETGPGWLINFCDNLTDRDKTIQIWIESWSTTLYIRYLYGGHTALNVNPWREYQTWDYIQNYVYQKTEVDTLLNNHLFVQSFDVSISTLGAAGGSTAAYGTFETDIKISGFTPLGVVGYNTNGTNGTSIFYAEMYVSGNKLYVLARNTNAGKDCDSSSKVNVQVLYTKNS